MGADNWGTCPKCKKDAEAAQAKALEEANASYGKITADDYTAKMLAATKPITLHQELREDYEIKTDEDGEFRVSYSCSCRDCGFRFSFEHSQQVTEP